MSSSAYIKRERSSSTDISIKREKEEAKGYQQVKTESYGSDDGQSEDERLNVPIPPRMNLDYEIDRNKKNDLHSILQSIGVELKFLARDYTRYQLMELIRNEAQHAPNEVAAAFVPYRRHRLDSKAKALKISPTVTAQNPTPDYKENRSKASEYPSMEDYTNTNFFTESAESGGCSQQEGASPKPSVLPRGIDRALRSGPG